ncbi:MAG: hypothetical protein HY875_14990 [Chloroflexi bacterium]|nr:hypothetical protein [Chloroflexota bacterium]
MEADWARPVVHWEIQAQDPAKIRDFYAAMFNWTIGDGPIMRFGAGVGPPEPGPGGHISSAATSRVVVHIQVRDLRESLERAAALGGSILREPFQIPGGATIAAILDPEGNQVGLVQQ